MIINMRDPESLAAWIEVRPGPHWQLLKAIVAGQPAWQEAAREAHKLVKARRQVDQQVAPTP